MTEDFMKEKIAAAEEYIAGHRDKVRQGHWRQKFHFMPEVGWMNDPNGIIEFRGKYHFFYQFFPYEPFWGSMHWGHAVSKDMIHWDHLPVALAPSEVYDDHCKGGCFSGSAIEKDGKLYLIYTGTYNEGDGFKQVQCLACSEDGIHFEKYEGNPVLCAPKGYDEANFRDPCVWEHDGSYYMVCGASRDQLAKALLFRSEDLLHWQFVNVLAESRGDLGYMWECPDFFELDGKYVLLISPMGTGDRTALYLVGDFSYETGKFTYTIQGDSDSGFDFYAPKSFCDSKGRRMVVGWANEWDWMPRWKDWGPTYKEGWCGSFSLVRQIRLNQDHTLRFLPIEEYQSIRRDEVTETNIMVLDQQCHIIQGTEAQTAEIQLNIDLEQTDAKKVIFTLKDTGQHQLKLELDLEHQEVILDRNQADGWSRGKVHTELSQCRRGQLDLDIYLDRSSAEIFLEGGRKVLSTNIFSEEGLIRNSICALGGSCQISRVSMWTMEVKREHR